jgi:hypothetical protein
LPADADGLVEGDLVVVDETVLPEINPATLLRLELDVSYSAILHLVYFKGTVSPEMFSR